MKFFLIIFISFFAKAQVPAWWIKVPDDAKHFWAAFLINEVSYSAQSFFLPKQKVGWRLLTSSSIAAGAAYTKEVWDNNRRNGTGFNFNDLVPGVWSIPIYAEFRVCINDVRRPPDIDTTMFQDLAPKPVKINDSTYCIEISPVITPTIITHD